MYSVKKRKNISATPYICQRGIKNFLWTDKKGERKMDNFCLKKPTNKNFFIYLRCFSDWLKAPKIKYLKKL